VESSTSGSDAGTSGVAPEGAEVGREIKLMSGSDVVGTSVSRMTRREILRRGGALGALLAAGPLLSACTGDDEPDRSDSDGGSGGELLINSFGGAWGEGIQFGFIDDFQAETGIKVTLLSTWDIAKSSAAVESGNTPPEDILDSAVPFTADLVRRDLVAKVDYSVFDSEVADAIPPAYRLEHMVGYGNIALSLGFDGEAFPEDGTRPANWADMWDVEQFPGSRAMMDWTIEPQPELPLLADGVSTDALYPIDLDRALSKMDELRPHILKLGNDSSSLHTQMLVDGQVVIEPAYTHRIRRVIEAGLERPQLSFDQARIQGQVFHVWKNAPNLENAMRFLAFIMRPDVQSQWAQIGNAVPVNPDAFENMSDEAKEQVGVGLDTTFDIDWQWYSEVNGGKSNLELVSERWTEWLAG
jgi:putative spermidine/putrescine transport system substrate-binding protein